MNRKVTTPRYIKPETICIGDTLAIRYTESDVIVTRVGTITHRDHHSSGTNYETARGFILLAEFGDGSISPRGAVITLLDRKAPSTQPTLDGFKEII